jgi:regulator of sirC expression with transglutaminase-like and TPR domain
MNSNQALNRSAGQALADANSCSDLLQAVAALGREVDQDSSPEAVVTTVRGWARRLCGRIAPDASVLNRLRMLNHFFFGELGFRGESGEDRADGAYLHRVIERRAGAADCLSLLYMEIGRAIGLRLRAVSLAGSFLVKLNFSGGVLLIDVSERGSTLSEDEVRAKLAARSRGAARRGGDAMLQRCLRGVSEDDILLRILRRLKQRHRAAGQWDAALAVQTRLVERFPLSTRERLDRADLYEKLECPRAAADDLAQCLQQDPDGAGAGEMRRRYLALQRRARRLH